MRSLLLATVVASTLAAVIPSTQAATTAETMNAISSGRAKLTQEAQSYLKQTGGTSWSDLVEYDEIKEVCNLNVAKRYSDNRSRTETCKWSPPGGGWAIYSIKVNEVENFKDRGSFTQNTYAEGQSFDLSNTHLIEQKSKTRAALDAAIKDKNVKVVAELEEEFRRFDQLEQSFKSSHNFLELTATAAAGRFGNSRIQINATVKIWRFR